MEYYRAYTIINNEIHWFYYDVDDNLYGRFYSYGFCKRLNLPWHSNFKELNFLKKCLKNAQTNDNMKWRYPGEKFEVHIVKMISEDVEDMNIEIGRFKRIKKTKGDKNEVKQND